MRRGFVLHKEGGEAVEHFAEEASVPLEEVLLRAEYGADYVCWNALLFKLCEVVVPKFVLYKDCNLRFYSLQEGLCVAGGIYGQVEDPICLCIVFAQLVTAWGEEG